MADLSDVLVAMNEGFGKVHEKMDKGFKDIHDGNTGHRQGCEIRFQSIEKTIAIGEALEKQTSMSLPHKLLVASAMAIAAAFSIGVGAFIWKLFLGHISLVMV